MNGLSTKLVLYNVASIILFPVILTIRAGNNIFIKKNYVPTEQATDKICLQNLEKNTLSRFGIKSGSRYYDGICTCDAFFASWGLIYLNKSTTLNKSTSVKTTILVLVQYQRPDGLIPLRIYKDSNLGSLNCKNKQIKKSYSLDINGFEPLDTCAQFIILNHMYLSNTGDKTLFDKYKDKIDLAFTWLKSKTNKGLLGQSNYTFWHHSLKLKGPLLYINVLYYRAIQCYEKMNGWSHKKSIRIKKLIHIKFWNSKYLMMTPHDNNFCLVGNALAIIYDLVTEKEAELIILERLKMGDTFFVPVNRDHYNIKNLYIFLELWGLADLHNNLIWPWVNILFMIAMIKHSDKYIPQVIKWLQEFDIYVKKYGNLYSCYTKNKKPVQKTFYQCTSESTKLSGLYIYLSRLLQKNKFDHAFKVNNTNEVNSKCLIS